MTNRPAKQESVLWSAASNGAPHRVCVAPMLDWTTRHCRYLLRLLSARAVLYSEMITTAALLHGTPDRWLRFHPAEHPVALQLGGSDPVALARCAAIGAAGGYDEINLNVGCPSDRVQAGRFGACLMAEPALVAECVAAMRARVSIPVTVKTRLGIDDRDSFEELAHFISSVAAAGCQTFVLHARKAWLQGLNPKQNRDIPPLRYDWVHRVKAEFPQLEIVINGGLETIEQMQAQLRRVDGVMIGREAYRNPFVLAQVDTRIFGDAARAQSRESVLLAYREYLAGELACGTRLSDLTRPLLGLFQGVPGARRWRRSLSTAMRDGADGPAIIDRTLASLFPAGTARPRPFAEQRIAC